MAIHKCLAILSLYCSTSSFIAFVRGVTISSRVNGTFPVSGYSYARVECFVMVPFVLRGIALIDMMVHLLVMSLTFVVVFVWNFVGTQDLFG